MAKFKFRLQSFLGVKEKIEEQKKVEYGTVLRKLDEENNKLKLLINEKHIYINSFKESLSTKVSPFNLKIHNDYIEVLKERIIAQNKIIDQVKEIVERRRLELVEAMKERKMLDTLKEKDYEQFLKDELIAEQKLIDEVVSYRYHS